MARHAKQTVDYFPHIVKQGKTMAILEARYGNTGYAFWFKILELLAETEGHFYDCGNAVNMEFLQARTHTTEETAKEILDLLSDLKAIDCKLWLHDKVIWSDNFIANITDAYKRRTIDLPHKPLVNGIYVSINNADGGLCKHYVDRKQQRRVEKSKEEKSREEETVIVDENSPTAPKPLRYDFGTDDEQYLQAAIYFRGKMLEYDPKRRVPKETPKALQKWADDMRKVFELDGRTRDEFKQVITFLDRDDFWQANIQSPKKLREKWDTLIAQSRRRKTQHERNMEVLRGE